MPLRGLVLLIGLLASLPVCFVRPFYGIVLWAIIAFLNPQSYTWGAATAFPWAMAVAIPTLIGLPIFCRDWLQRVSSREFFLLLIMWGWFTLTSLVSVHTPLFVHHAEDTWHRWDYVSKVLLMTVVTMIVVDSFARLRMLIVVIAGCFGFFVLKAVPFMIITGGNYRLYGPPKSMIADNNDFGLALNMTLPLFFFLAQSETNRWLKRLFGFLVVVAVPAIFCTYSRGALLGLVAVMGLMFLQYKRRMLLVPIIVMGALVAILFAPAAWKTRMDPGRDGAIDASAKSRFNAWTYSLRIAAISPIFGGGFDTFTPELFARYAPHPDDVHGPHSIYFGVLAEHGFIGLGLYLALVGSCFKSAGRVVKLGRLYGDRRAINFGNMFRFGLVGFLVSGLFLGRAYFDYYFTIVACIVILKRLCLSEWAESNMDFEEQAA